MTQSREDPMMRIVRFLLTALVLVVVVGCAHPDWIESTLVTVDATGTWVGEWGGGLYSGAHGSRFARLARSFRGT